MKRAVSLTDLTSLADQVAHSLPPGAVVWLEGDLGAGKTTFAQALAAALGARDAVTSPTFTLVHRYDGPRGTIAHVDCYRFRHPDEAESIDWADLLRSDLLLVEWPERGGSWVPAPTVRVRLSHHQDPDLRAVHVLAGVAA